MFKQCMTKTEYENFENLARKTAAAAAAIVAKKSEPVSTTIVTRSVNATPVKKSEEVNVAERTHSDIVTPKAKKSEEVNVAERTHSDIVTPKAKKSEKAKVINKVPIEKVKPLQAANVVTMQNRENNNLSRFIHALKSMNFNFTQIIKLNTGLYELSIIYPNNIHRLINVDVDGLLYDKQFKFFDGRINPGDEYTKPCYLLTRENLLAPVGAAVPISLELFNLNKILDLQTLKADSKERTAVFEKAFKALTIMQDEIKNAAGKEPYRFAFARYENKDNFSLVSSKKNLASNLDPNSYLNVTKEIWINVKDKKATLTASKYKK